MNNDLAGASPVDQPVRPLSEEDWTFVWQALEGTKLDAPRIRANVENLLAMAEEFEALVVKNHALAREAHTWSKACENASTALHKLRTPHPRLRVEYWTGQWWEPLHGVKLDQALEALEPAPQWSLDLRPNVRGNRPAPAGGVRLVCGAFGTFAHQPYAACRSGSG